MNKKENRFYKNIGLGYLFSFIRSFDISSAIWVLYMVYKGLPLWQIGITEGIFHAATLVFEVPTGAAADLLGRKNVMFIGRICYAISCIVILLSGDLFGFSFAFVLSALSYTLNSGSEEALVYDSMKTIGEEERYIKVNGRINVIIEVSQGLATFAGGVLAEYSYFFCYFMCVVIAFLGLVPVIFMKEPPIHNEKTEKRIGIKEHFKKSYRAIKENPEIIRILLYYPVSSAFYVVLFFYGQQYFSELGFNKIQISLIMLGSSAVSCIGALSSVSVLGKFKENTKYIGSGLMGISIILVSRYNVILSIIAFATASFANALLEPIQSSSLNALIPSEQRATIISVDSMCFSLAMICFFPLCGVIASMHNLHVTFLILGFVETAMVILLVKGKKE